MNSPHKSPVTRKKFLCDDVIMSTNRSQWQCSILHELLVLDNVDINYMAKVIYMVSYYPKTIMELRWSRLNSRIIKMEWNRWNIIWWYFMIRDDLWQWCHGLHKGVDEVMSVLQYRNPSDFHLNPDPTKFMKYQIHLRFPSSWVQADCGLTLSCTNGLQSLSRGPYHGWYNHQPS